MTFVGNLLSTGVLVVVFASTAAAVAQPQPGPSLPYEDPGVCPFEGCVYRSWRASKTVTVRRTRSLQAPIVFTVAPRENVTAITGVVVTLSPGKVRFRRAVDLNWSGAFEPVMARPGVTVRRPQNLVFSTSSPVRRCIC